jgi:hypothetical protein
MSRQTMSATDSLLRSSAFAVVLATTVLLSGCGFSSGDNQRETPSATAFSVENVDIRGTDLDFQVSYRTRASVRDEQAQRREIPRVWNAVVKPRLKPSTARVIMVPEDSTLTSVSFAFTKSADGEWIAHAPWKIVITTR